MLIKTIHHDALPGFEANEHIDHTTVSISAGGILSGGGTIAANRTISLANGDIDHDQLTNFASNEHYLQSAIVATGALNSGSITSGFGSIDVGDSTITTTGKIRADNGFGVGINPTASFPFNAEEDVAGQWAIRIKNTNTGVNGLAQHLVISDTGDLSIIAHGSGRSTPERWGFPVGGTGEILCFGMPLSIGTIGSGKDLVFGTNGILAMTIDGTTRYITIEENLTVKEVLTVIGDTTVQGDFAVNGSTNLGNNFNDDFVTINGVYILPANVGTTDYLVKQTGTGTNWGYIDPGTLDVATADAVAVTDETADTETFLGFYTAATGDLPGKTNAALKFNASTNALTLNSAVTVNSLTDGTATLTGGNLTNIGTIGAATDADLLTLSADLLTVAGDFIVGSTAFDVDSTNMTVGIGTAALPDTLLKVQRTGTVTTDQEGLSFVPFYSVGAANLDFVAAKFAGQLFISDGFDVDNLFGAKINLFTATTFNADLTNAYGIYSEMNFETSGRNVSTITTARHINLLNATTPGVSTITTLTGLHIEEQTTGDTNWQIFSMGGNTHFGSGTHEFIGTLKTTSAGRIKNTTRYTTTQVISVTDEIVLANTDGSAWTVTLPTGVGGQTYRIINSGSSGNQLTIAVQSGEDLLGVTDDTFILNDGEALTLTFNATDGWY